MMAWWGWLIVWVGVSPVASVVVGKLLRGPRPRQLDSRGIAR